MSDLREAFRDKYSELIGRNRYSQDLRQYVYTPAKDGVYYSDCSSSGMATYRQLGLNLPLWNTAGMHYNGRKVDVGIRSGHVATGDIHKLRVGMALMFRGTDPARPLQIGHVEYIYKVDGLHEEDITICGHGSGRPSLKNMWSYLEQREGMKAPNGLSKGLVEVLDFLPADEYHGTPIEADLTVTTGVLNIRETPVDGRVIGSAERDEVIHCTEQSYTGGAYWFRGPSGWMSGRYLRGWIKQYGAWWYTPGNGEPYAADTVINDYVLDHEGWMVTPERMAADGKILY